jgi:maltose alpha-D-glucosyltransferase/alpha-amylase
MPVADARTETESAFWYKDAIIYQLHVKAFFDSNADGIGDFAGLTEKLDYLQELGVTALWLLPFYPSPGRDDGYDISDYRKINPDFGSMKDFRRFLQEAKRRNLRVISELVINHTSDQHPWFKRARRSRPGSSARDWYVWSDNDQRYKETRIIFRDTEKSNWSWDPEANAFFWHRFYAHQPDLNFDNPRVLWAIIQVMKRWLDMGVDGFRLDAIPYLVERDGTNNENLPETHEIIKRIRAELDAHARDKLLLAEANQWPEDVSAYFAEGDECHMAYHFPLMPRIYMAIAQEDRFPIVDILRQTPEIPDNCQWALFLRNHDELTLEMVTDIERDYLWSTYATDPRARINLGIRRRLAPLMGNDRRKIELMNSLLFSFPGTPIIYYGDEIGMGDNIYLGDRNGVRTPMQWSPDRNGGFSTANPARLYTPLIMDPLYGYESVNVEAQSQSTASLLSWTKRMISVRKSSKVFGRGTLSFVRPANRSVLVYVREYQGETILCVANLSRTAQAAEIDLSAWKGRVPQEMLGRVSFPRIGDGPYVLTLSPYGFYWFELCDRPETVASPTLAPDLETLVVSSTGAIDPRSRRMLERDVLPAFLPTRRWFAGKGESISVALDAVLPISQGQTGVDLHVVSAKGRRHSGQYLLPLAVRWARLDRTKPDPNALAAARRGPREGIFLDVATDQDFVSDLIRRLHEGGTVAASGYTLELEPSKDFAEQPLAPLDPIRSIQTEQSNTTALVGRDYVLKLFRRFEPGVSPEIEVGRFLRETAFQHAPALLGSIEMATPQAKGAVAVLHRMIQNQGDAWTVTSGYLDRYIDDLRVLADGDEQGLERAAYQRIMAATGTRLGELHLALASRSDMPAFAPEPVTGEDAQDWIAHAGRRVDRILDELQRRRNALGDDAAMADRLLGSRTQLAAKLALQTPAIDKIRHHGDFHLGQMLVAKDDVYIIDFEGEPKRTLEERRQKAPALRDVAGLMRSIDYSSTDALQRAVRSAPDKEGRLAAALADWRIQSSASFLAAYRAVVAGSRLWPAEEKASAELLDFFLLDKALYEIEYELSNRPDWLSVPLAGVLRIIHGEGAAA